MLNGSDSKCKLELPLPSDQTTHKLMFIYDISAVIIEKKLKYE